MANLIPVNQWDNVYQREPTDFLDASPQGLDNLPNQQLLNRTEWLRQHLPEGGLKNCVLSGPTSAGNQSLLTIGLGIGGSIVFNDAEDDVRLAFGLGYASGGEITDSISVTNRLENEDAASDITDGEVEIAIGYDPSTGQLESLILWAFTITYSYATPLAPQFNDLWCNLNTGIWSVFNGSAWVSRNPIAVVGRMVVDTGNITLLESYPYRMRHWNEQTHPGTVKAVAGSKLPLGGYLFAAGQAVSRSVYSRLFREIGTLYGAGDGSTTFNLPDLRGEFLRGWDAGRGIDTGRVLGSAQADELKAHTHQVLLQSDAGTTVVPRSSGSSGNASTAETESTGGSETRPRNVAVAYWIKY